MIAHDKSWYEPEEPKNNIESMPEGERLQKSLDELMVLKFVIPAELDDEINFDGYCECDYCRSHPEEAVRLSKGKTVVQLDQKLIYCDCLEAYLKSRMAVLR